MLGKFKRIFFSETLVTQSTSDLGDIVDKQFDDIYNKCRKYTMLTKERLYANYQAIKYVEKNNIEGDIVECGVWKGGSSMIFLQYLVSQRKSQRNIYLYDTFEGMSAPEDVDKKTGAEELAEVKWKIHAKDNHNSWCYSSLDEVKSNVYQLGYPKEKIHFIKGKVEETLPNYHHKQIAVLRLDTDWYSSTKHELIHLFPLLVPKGVIIIDDYGCWEGARKAVDEYFGENNINILLNRIDSAGRMGINCF